MTFSSFTMTAYKIFIAVKQLHNLVISVNKHSMRAERQCICQNKQLIDEPLCTNNVVCTFMLLFKTNYVCQIAKIR